MALLFNNFLISVLFGYQGRKAQYDRTMGKKWFMVGWVERSETHLSKPINRVRRIKTPAVGRNSRATW